MEESRAAANATGQILVAKYGQHPWILQIMEAVQGAVDIGVKQLSGVAPVANAAPQDPYNFPARTGQEVIQANPQMMDRPADNPVPTQQQVQQGMSADNDMFAQLARVADPGRPLGQAPPSQPMPRQQQPVQQTTSGLILPAGMTPQPVQGVQNERADPGHNSDSVSWLL